MITLLVALTMSFILHAKGHLCIYPYKSRVHLYKIMVFTDGTTRNMCPYALLTAIGAVCYWLTVYHLWCASMWILYNYRYICVTVWCTVLSLYTPSYNIVRCGFYLTMLCLSDDPVSLIV